jgi:hypothetical protein
MNERYGARTARYDLRPRTPRDYSHLFTTDGCEQKDDDEREDKRVVTTLSFGANKVIVGKQCTVICHVDNLKVSHAEPKQYRLKAGTRIRKTSSIDRSAWQGSQLPRYVFGFKLSRKFRCLNGIIHQVDDRGDAGGHDRHFCDSCRLKSLQQTANAELARHGKK